MIIFFSTPVTLGYHFILFIQYSSMRNLTENTTSDSKEDEGGVCHLIAQFYLPSGQELFTQYKEKDEIQGEWSRVCFNPCLMLCMVFFRTLKEAKSKRLL